MSRVDWGRMTETQTYDAIVEGLQVLTFEKLVEALFEALTKDQLLELSEHIEGHVA